MNKQNSDRLFRSFIELRTRLLNARKTANSCENYSEWRTLVEAYELVMQAQEIVESLPPWDTEKGGE